MDLRPAFFALRRQHNVGVACKIVSARCQQTSNWKPGGRFPLAKRTFQSLGLQGLSEACNRDLPIQNRMLWGTLWLVMFVCCAIQCVVCVERYLSGPINSRITYHKAITVPAPYVTVCLDDDRDRRPAVWKPILEKRFNHVSDYESAYDLLLQTNMSVSELWNISIFVVNKSISYIWQASGTHRDSMEKIDIITVNGICAMYKPLTEMPCAGRQAELNIDGHGDHPEPNNVGLEFLTLFHSEAEIPLLRYYGPHVSGLFMPYNRIVTVALSAQENRYVSSWGSPCVPTEESSQCEADCFDALIRKESNLSNLCRLPFMKDDGIPLCVTASQFEAMYSATTAATDKMLTDNSNCKCAKPCNTLTYNEEYISQDSEYRQEVFAFEIIFPKCRLRVLEDQYSYTTANFISDVGGSLGICLGWSVLSIIAVFETAIFKLIR